MLTPIEFEEVRFVCSNSGVDETRGAMNIGTRENIAGLLTLLAEKQEQVVRSLSPDSRARLDRMKLLLAALFAFPLFHSLHATRRLPNPDRHNRRKLRH